MASMHLERTHKWMDRAHFSAVSQVPLGTPGELWDSNPNHYEGRAQLEARLHVLGRKWTRRGMAYQLASSLLDDLLVAAGGVEGAILRFRAACEETRTWIAQNGLQPTPSVPTGVVDLSTAAAWYTFAELLIWLRTVEERLERSGYRKNYDKQGILPALRPKRLKKRVALALERYRADPAINSTRYLSNFTLHAALIANPSSGAILRPDGSLHLPMPDPPTSRVAHRHSFTWNQNRDGIDAAEEMWQAVQVLIDDVLDAFERATPKRLRREPDQLSPVTDSLGNYLQ